MLLCQHILVLSERSEAKQPMSAPALAVTILTSGGRAEARQIALQQAVIADWTGRDPVARDKPIDELEAPGVPRRLSEMLPLRELIERGFAGELPDGTALSAAYSRPRAAFGPPRRSTMKIDDPVLDRTIRGGYHVVTLPIGG
jgi:hypothetical protein